MVQAAGATKTVNFRMFRTHGDGRKRVVGKQARLEQIGAASALELAEQICAELRAKKPGRLDTRALAEFQVAIECAASVLSKQLGVSSSAVNCSNPLLPPTSPRGPRGS
jgi:hypothetical protein